MASSTSASRPVDYGLKVNDERISAETLNRAWQERQAQYQQSLNGAERTEAQMRACCRSSWIDEYVRRDVAAPAAPSRAGYRATDAQVRRGGTQSEPAFQVEGKYDSAAWRGTHAGAAWHDARSTALLAERRQTLQIGAIEPKAVQLSDFLDATLKWLAFTPWRMNSGRCGSRSCPRINFQAGCQDRRRSRSSRGTTAHPNDYMSPESVRLQYAELQLDSIASQITVTPEKTCRPTTTRTRAATAKSRNATRTIS